MSAKPVPGQCGQYMLVQVALTAAGADGRLGARVRDHLDHRGYRYAKQIGARALFLSRGV